MTDKKVKRYIKVDQTASGPVITKSESIAPIAQTQPVEQAEPIMVQTPPDNSPDPIVISLPPWIRNLSPSNWFSANNVLMVVAVIGAYWVYQNYTNQPNPKPVDPDVIEVVDFDFGDLDEDKQALVLKYVAEFSKYHTKDFKSKAKVLVSYGEETFDNDEQKKTWLNDQFSKANDKDVSGLQGAMADIIEADIVAITGEYMQAAAKASGK